MITSKKIPIPKTVTYKEIMLVYGFNISRATKKIYLIRGILGKKMHQNILIAEFCQAENIDQQIFVAELTSAIGALHVN